MAVSHSFCYGSNPFLAAQKSGSRYLQYGVVVGIHVIAVVVLVLTGQLQRIAPPPQILQMRFLSEEAVPPPKVTPPKPVAAVPSRATPTPQTPPPPVAPAIMTAATEASATPSTFVVPPQPVPKPVVATPAPVAVPVLTSACFDADYLHNPTPSYPSFSRKMGEEGKVMLRVKVSPSGTALEVEVKESSQYPRLDQAAREAVLRWRFVPARRGSEAVEAWVLVPITFSLDN
jgi:protein TonB